jgi:EspG family
LTDRNRPSEELAGPLRVLAHPDHQLDLRIRSRDGGLVASGAAARENGALAIRRGEEVTVAAVRGTALVAAVVGLIGPMSPGRGAAVNVPADLFDEATEATTDGHISSLVDYLTEMGMRRGDVSSLIHMCRGTRALGQIGTVHYVGRSARSGPWVIGFHRTEAGYYLLLRRPSTYGGETVTIRPLDAPQLTQLTEELLKVGRARELRHRHAW